MYRSQPASQPTRWVSIREGRPGWDFLPSWAWRCEDTGLGHGGCQLLAQPWPWLTPLHGDLARNSRKCIIRVGVKTTCLYEDTSKGLGLAEPGHYYKLWPLLLKGTAGEQGTIVQGQMSSWAFRSAWGVQSREQASRAAVAHIQNGCGGVGCAVRGGEEEHGV